MLAGLVIASILSGGLSLAVSVLAGHSLLISRIAYIAAGICGMFGFALAATSRNPLIR
jgi:uncharacterized membrane protein YuzA (DUF378 family)